MAITGRDYLPALFDLLAQGANLVAPNMMSLMRGDAPPPLSNLPDTPQKVPSTEDPRPLGAAAELTNIGMHVLPLGPAPASAARSLPALLGLARREPTVLEMMASKSPFMYNPPARPQRPFSADYPRGAPADAAGRLTADIEGRPLHARWLVGRRVVGGDDKAFPAAEFNALAEATTGRGPAVVPARQMGSDFGRVVLNRYTRQPQVIQLRKDMLPDTAAKVHAHELGHVIDELAGQIPTKGLSNELKRIYNTLNNPNRAHPDRAEAAAWGKPFTPQALGYKGEESREYMVEAIRAYMADPNYLKTAAPKTAAAIREAVNSHPTLSKIIQFNTLAALMGLGGLPEPSASAPEPVQ